MSAVSSPTYPDLSSRGVQHLAIIMDGNRRWARGRGFPEMMGHDAGAETLRRISDACWDRGITTLTVFAFSTENWQRTPDEVKHLLDLFARMLEKDIVRLHEKNIRLRILGDISAFPVRLAALMRNGMETTQHNTAGTFNLAVNYGGRDEIVRAVRAIVTEGVVCEAISEEVVSRHLDTVGQEDPDMIIRTSGEQRLSGFLPWQGTYAELYFCDMHWPDFTEQDLDIALEEFARRSRRFGV